MKMKPGSLLTCAWRGLGFTALWLGSAQAWALDADAATKQLMQEQYGAYSAGAKGWPAKSDGVAFVMKVIQSRKVSTPYGERLYVFAAGDMASKDAGHVSPGLAGAFVLEEKDGKVSLVAGIKNMTYGAFGTAPDKVSLVQLGPDHYYGWVYESGYTAQGYTSSYNDVLAPRGKSVAKLAGIVSHLDNEGAKPCDEKETKAECENLEYALKVDTVRSDVKVYPLIVTRTGIKAGKKTKPEVTRVEFDEKKWKYTLPETLNVGY